ncbi:hypothetical protein FOZ63_022688 [Perkinsus olseni]|uniref:Uncharacterized protein n=2 Tax=Perkinsus olseni TaxID=32597 RepID=A0A7J6RWD4_PEROL|nr:hypothetical protein FOZ63_022688 [Perkinsus olseni]
MLPMTWTPVKCQLLLLSGILSHGLPLTAEVYPKMDNLKDVAKYMERNLGSMTVVNMDEEAVIGDVFKNAVATLTKLAGSLREGLMHHSVAAISVMSNGYSPRRGVPASKKRGRGRPTIDESGAKRRDIIAGVAEVIAGTNFPADPLELAILERVSYHRQKEIASRWISTVKNHSESAGLDAPFVILGLAVRRADLAAVMSLAEAMDLESRGTGRDPGMYTSWCRRHLALCKPIAASWLKRSPIRRSDRLEDSSVTTRRDSQGSRSTVEEDYAAISRRRIAQAICDQPDGPARAGVPQHARTTELPEQDDPSSSLPPANSKDLSRRLYVCYRMMESQFRSDHRPFCSFSTEISSRYLTEAHESGNTDDLLVVLEALEELILRPGQHEWIKKNIRRGGAASRKAVSRAMNLFRLHIDVCRILKTLGRDAEQAYDHHWQGAAELYRQASPFMDDYHYETTPASEVAIPPMRDFLLRVVLPQCLWEICFVELQELCEIYFDFNLDDEDLDEVWNAASPHPEKKRKDVLMIERRRAERRCQLHERFPIENDENATRVATCSPEVNEISLASISSHLDATRNLDGTTASNRQGCMGRILRYNFKPKQLSIPVVSHSRITLTGYHPYPSIEKPSRAPWASFEASTPKRQAKTKPRVLVPATPLTIERRRSELGVFAGNITSDDGHSYDADDSWCLNGKNSSTGDIPAENSVPAMRPWQRYMAHVDSSHIDLPIWEPFAGLDDGSSHINVPIWDEEKPTRHFGEIQRVLFPLEDEKEAGVS